MTSKKLYDYEEQKEIKKKKKVSNKKEIKGKEKAKRENKEEASNHLDNENEIIIGVTVHPNEKKEKKELKPKRKKQALTKKKKNIPKNSKSLNNFSKESTIKNKNYNISHPNMHNKNVKKHRTGLKVKIIRRLSIVFLIVGAIIFAMVSPIFNTKQIKVTGNNKLSSEKIIGMSGIEVGQNVFKINKNEIKKKLKQNGYIENVQVKRKLPDQIEMAITERISSFAIEYGNGYVLINNQGYITEIADEKGDIPILTGTVTKEDFYQEANRLDDQDLNHLNVVLKIMDAASANGIEMLISSIDISDLNNVKLYMESEDKIAYLGDCSNLIHRMQWVKTILENREGIAGEILVDMNLNMKDPYFRESI